MKNLGRIVSPALKTPSIQPSSFRAFSYKIENPTAIVANNDNIVERQNRIKEFRSRLIADTPRHIFEISKPGQGFLSYVNNNLNKRYSRGGKAGEGLVGVDEAIKLVSGKTKHYNDTDIQKLTESAEEVQNRMRVKVSESYLKHALSTPKGAKDPNPILKVVMPDAREIDDLSGEIDPSNQNRYSPMPGLLHKYGMLLAFVSINCSSHCRYCYRLDLFNGSSNKTKADMLAIAAYIKTYNNLIDDAIKTSGEFDKELGLWVDKKTREPLLHVREILFSGGDPMTLPNATLARYMVLMAEAGIETIRIGTKDLVFHPQRFDEEFWQMMDLFHKNYPEVKLDIVGHYVHPFELVEPKIDRDGEYIYDIDKNYKIREDLKPVLKEIDNRKSWIGHFNQFPIITGINDSADVIRLIARQCRRLGIQMHNIYACREIVGNKHFRGENTIERQYQLVEKSKSGLSGIENHHRLIMSTEYGKVEVCAVSEHGVLLKLNRFVNEQQFDNTSITVDTSKLSNGQKFYWLTDKVIEEAVSSDGKKILSELAAEDNSLVKGLKKLAAEQVVRDLESAPENPLKAKSKKFCPTKLEIEVVGRNGSQIIEVDLRDGEYLKKHPTLATILSKKDFVEAACNEQLSCSTCVAEVESLNSKLPKATEDEEDLVGVAEQELQKLGIKPSPNLRATCQIPVEGGKRYKVTTIDALENNKGTNQR